MTLPCSSTAPMRSESPSKAMPRSAPRFAHFRHQVGEIRGYGGIGMVVREMAVHFEEQLGGVHVDLLENAMDHGAGRAIARIGDNLDAAIQMELRRNLVDVGRHGVGAAKLSAAGFEIRALDDVQDILNGFAVQRVRAADALESVVFGRIVAAGDHDGAVGLQVLRRE